MVGYLLMALSGGACDCIPVHTFMKSMGPNVFLAEVIDGPGFDLTRATVPTHETTTVRVLENIYGNILKDTVVIGEGSESFCLGHLVNSGVGDKVVITGNVECGLADIIDHNGRYKGRRDFAHLTILGCNVQSLDFSSGKVRGMITKNAYRKRQEITWWLQKYTPLRFLSEETQSRMTSISLRPEDEQHMSIEQLKKLVQKAYKR